MSRRPLLVVVLVAGLAAGACGVPTDDDPRTLSPDNVRFGLLAPATSTTMTVRNETRQSPIGIYLLTSDGALVRQPRSVTGAPTVEKALAVLLQGPLPNEADAGLATALAGGPDDLLDVRQTVDGLVTVDLSSDVLVTGERQIRAIAQVVFTVTDFGVSGVLFRFDGEPREVPDGTGELTSEPLDRSDFRNLR